MWVADIGAAKIYAYSMETRTRDTSKEIFSLATDITNPYAIWSDGKTMWVADARSTKLFAYSMSDGSGVLDSYFPSVDPLDSSAVISGIASDGATMWALDQENNRILSFNMPSPAAPQRLTATLLSYDTITLEWDKGSSTVEKYQVRISHDGGTTWFIDWDDIYGSDRNTTGYKAQFLPGDTEYTIQVRAVSPRGAGAAAAITASTTAAARTDSSARSITVDGIEILRFDSDTSGHQHGVANSVSRVTFDVIPNDALGDWGIPGGVADRDLSMDGLQVDLERVDKLSGSAHLVNQPGV